MRWNEITESPVVENNFPWNMPPKAKAEIISWPVKTKSPYSHSYYDQPEGEITWETKPIGSLRISDHWNFKSRGGIHCQTDRAIGNSWALAKWDGEKYHILKIYGRRKLGGLSAAEVKRLNPHMRVQWMKLTGKTLAD